MKYPLLASLLLAGCLTATGSPRRIPLIFDTDFGDNMDDAWALGLLLRSPRIDLRLVLTDGRGARAKARVLAHFLSRVGRSGIPIGIGVDRGPVSGPLYRQARDYRLADYPGPVYEQGVTRALELIRKTRRPLTLLVTGPATNIAEALRRQPSIAREVRLVTMGGSLGRGYTPGSPPEPEYNIKADVPAARRLYGAGWPILMAPLDTAAGLELRGKSWRRFLDSKSRLARVLVHDYRLWAPSVEWARFDPERESPALFDCAAVALLLRPGDLELQARTIRITAAGQTVEKSGGRPVQAALAWRHRARFLDWLAATLTHP